MIAAHPGRPDDSPRLRNAPPGLRGTLQCLRVGAKQLHHLQHVLHQGTGDPTELLCRVGCPPVCVRAFGGCCGLCRVGPPPFSRCPGFGTWRALVGSLSGGSSVPPSSVRSFWLKVTRCSPWSSWPSVYVSLHPHKWLLRAALRGYSVATPWLLRGYSVPLSSVC